MVWIGPQKASIYALVTIQCKFYLNFPVVSIDIFDVLNNSKWISFVIAVNIMNWILLHDIFHFNFLHLRPNSLQQINMCFPPMNGNPS